MSTRSVQVDRFAYQPLPVRTLLAAVIAVGANVAVTASATSAGLTQRVALNGRPQVAP